MAFCNRKINTKSGIRLSRVMTYAFDLHFQLRNGGERTLADDGGGGGHARCTAGRVFRVATICVRGSVLQRKCVMCALTANAHVALCVIDEWTDRQRKERQQALKLLRRVELIVAEVSVRLTHLANQAEDAVANEDREDEVTAEVAEPETSSSLNSCGSLSRCVRTCVIVILTKMSFCVVMAM